MSSLDLGRWAPMRLAYCECRYKILELESQQKTRRKYSESSISSTEMNSKAEVNINIYIICWQVLIFVNLFYVILRWLRAGPVDIQENHPHASGWRNRHPINAGTLLICINLCRVIWGLSPVDKV